MEKGLLFEDKLDVLALISSSSDSDEDVVRGSSRPGRAPNVACFREEETEQLHRDFFSVTPVNHFHAS